MILISLQLFREWYQENEIWGEMPSIWIAFESVWDKVIANFSLKTDRFTDYYT